MLEANNKVSIDGWVMRIHRPESIGPFPVLLMLHGWTGDENSMGVFTPRLPRNVLLVAPRGLYKAKGSGYSWHDEISSPWPRMTNFQPAIERILLTISNANFPDGDFSKLHLLGFSQGAALAYALAIMYPERVASLAGLSGFLPDGTSTWLKPDRMNGLPVFIAHGTRDDRVPVDKARMSVELLEKAGAEVVYCEDDVGHKLSAKCFRGLEAFYKRVNC